MTRWGFRLALFLLISAGVLCAFSLFWIVSLRTHFGYTLHAMPGAIVLEQPTEDLCILDLPPEHFQPGIKIKRASNANWNLALKPQVLRLYGARFLIIPFWIVLGLLGVPALLLRPRRNQPASEEPTCSCGYILIGNRSGRCPECGTACQRPRASP